MKFGKWFVFLIAVSFITMAASGAWADCRGCCAGHGGTLCKDGKTVCKDGTALTDNCVKKGCDACAAPAPKKPKTTTPPSTPPSTTTPPATTTPPNG